MRVVFIVLICFSLMMLQFACASNTNVKGEYQWVTVTVKYLNFEGGFYGLITEDGTKLLPVNLDKSYKKNGCVFKVKGRFLKNMISIQQWGQVFSITEVEPINTCIDKQLNQF